MTKKPTAKAKLTSRTVPVTDEVPVAVTTAITSPINHPTHEDISRRAYEIYVARGQAHGSEVEDWIQAERELMAKTHRNN